MCGVSMNDAGYFEWTGPTNDRQPHYFTRTDGQPIALAGLWDRWRSEDKSAPEANRCIRRICGDTLEILTRWKKRRAKKKRFGDGGLPRTASSPKAARA